MNVLEQEETAEHIEDIVDDLIESVQWEDEYDDQD